MNLPMITLLRRLWTHILPRRRAQFGLLLGLAMVSSIAEVVSLGSVLPFIGILTQPEKIFASPWLSGTLPVLGITSETELVLPFALAFALAALMAGGLRLLLLWVSIRLANATGADLSIEVYLRTLYQDYSVHIARSSSEIISGITQKVGTATSVLISLVTVVTSAILFAAMMATLIAVDPLVAIAAAISFGSAYGVIAWRTRRRLMLNSHSISKEQTQVVKALQEGLGSIRDVLLDGTQKLYCSVYQKAILQLQRASGENTFINQAPRYAMETLGMALIAALVLALSHRAGGVTAALPILAVLAVGAQRLLPLMQQLYGNWSVITGSKAALHDVLALLDQPLPAYFNLAEPEPLELKKFIEFEKVGFRYNSNSPWVLDDARLTISKGARVGIVGSTGSGKSTALDILMCLLQPTKGRILVDGVPISNNNRRAWQRSVAHVPQHIFLSDASIAENIAFGVDPDQIDLDRVRKAAQQAQIAEFIETRSEGYGAIVGERGVRLSGGQRQRIGIARALYKKANVLIFDEATSALDTETEDAVMKAIDGLSKDLTLFIIAHRLTTLKNCDAIVRLDCGIACMAPSYSQLSDTERRS